MDMHPLPRLAIAFALALAPVFGPVGCEPNPPQAQPTDSTDHVGLNNLLPVADGLWSGSNPEGDDGFRSLQAMGIRTIISVDGARPDVDRARQFGLRYVHMPLGYGGVTREQALQLVRAATELPGPIYIHCHHGKHRGPTAAAIVRRCRPDGWAADDAVAFLHRAGTDERYEGLYAAVREFQPPTPDELRAVPAHFPDAVMPAGVSAAMVDLDDVWEGLRRAQAGGWVAPDSLAVQLVEHYRELQRLPEVASRSKEFRHLLKEALAAAGELEAGLRAGDTARRDEAFTRSATLCTSCHRDHRDRAK